MVAPKLGFKEFDIGKETKYQKITLSEILIEIKEKINYKKINLASVGSLGFRKKTDAFKNKINVLDSHSVKIVHPNNFVIGIGSKQIDFVMNDLNDKFGVSTAYSVYKAKNIVNEKYLDLLLTKNLKKISSLYMIVSARQGKSVNKIDLFKHNFYIHILLKQEKIATFFTLIDKKIDLQNQKLKLLKDYKKGLLFEIFLKKNVKIDLVSVQKIWEICEINTGKLNANAMADGGKYPFFTCSIKNLRIDKYTFNCEAILISGNGVNVGYIKYYRGKFNAYQRTYILHNFKIDVFYLKAFLEAKLNLILTKQTNYGCIPYIVKNTLSMIDIDIYENTINIKIGKLFIWLNKKIDCENQNLKKINNLKKNLLEQIFI